MFSPVYIFLIGSNARMHIKYFSTEVVVSMFLAISYVWGKAGIWLFNRIVGGKDEEIGAKILDDGVDGLPTEKKDTKSL